MKLSMEKIVKVMGEIVDWGFMFVGIGELIVGNLDAMLTSSEYNKLLETSKEIKGVG